MQTQTETLDVVAEFPATASQQRFWYLHQLNPESVASNIAVHWELHGDCPAETIEQAFKAIIARHEVLRTAFVERNGQLFQQVVAETGFRLSTIDLRKLDKDDHAGRIAGIAAELSDRPFELTRPGHLRVALVRTGPRLTHILIAAHHAVFDGFSIRVLGDELGQLAAAFVKGLDPELPELALQYGDYALWREACETSGANDSDAQYWKHQLADMPYFSLPHDRPAPPASQRSGARIDIPLHPDFGPRLEAFARDRQTSAFSVGAAMTGTVLHRMTGETDVSFNATYAGRGETELEALIGVFINPIVLRLQMAGGQTLADAISHTTDVVRQALGHGDYPFDRLVSDLRPPRDPMRTPLTSVTFSLQPVFLQEQSYGPLTLTSTASLTPDITHDLAINITGRNAGWTIMIDYDVNRFDRRSIEAIGLAVRDTFDAAFDQPALRLEDLNISRPAQRKAAPARVVRAAEAPAPASGETADIVRAVWAEVLGLAPDACDGNFFDLGGHSLLVLRMLAWVGDKVGLRPSIADFLEAPTLSAFSARLAMQLAQQTDTPATEADSEPGADNLFNLIWLNEGQPDAPLILSVNQPFLYFGLARQLDDGFASANLHVTSPECLMGDPLDRMDQLVEDGTRLAAETAGDRPFVLIGQCVDGVLAQRIALRLDQIGCPPQTLAMIDSWVPRPGTSSRGRTRSKLRRIANYSSQALSGQLGVEEFMSKSRLGKKALVGMGRMDAPTEAEVREWHINKLLQDLVRAAPNDAYTGETLLFATASQEPRAVTERFGWGSLLAPDTAIFTLPGWHEDALLGTGTKDLANILRARLSRARAPLASQHLLP